MFIFFRGQSCFPCVQGHEQNVKEILRVLSHRNQTMADAFLYSFVSIASPTLTESVSYNIIRNLFHFNRDTSQFRDRKDNQTGIPVDLNRSFENNHITV